jgi:hypothetical protein
VVQATERQGVVRPVRWASRALLVLGGVAAGTAAAWAVSGATASAAPSDDAVSNTSATVTPVTDATAANLRDMTRGAAKLVGDASGAASAATAHAACPQEATSWSLPPSESARPAAPAGCRKHGSHRVIDRDVSKRVGNAVGNFADSAVVTPVERTLRAVEHIAVKPQEAPEVIKDSLKPSDFHDFGKNFWDLLNQQNGRSGSLPLPALPNLPMLPQTPVEHSLLPGAPGAVQDAAVVAGPGTAGWPGAAEDQSASRLARGADPTTTNHKTSSHRDQGNFPAPFAPAGLPIAPLSAPSVPGGSAPGGHFDGPTYGVPTWSSAAYCNAKAGSIHTGARYMPLTPGAQPGVTPD